MNKNKIMLKTFLQENQIIVPSYQHYGGLSGFQDYGIIGFKIKNKLINVWRKNFLTEEIHEVEIPTIMPYAILKASGHVDRFTDYVVYDKNNLCHRADHLAKKWFNDHKMPEMANMVDSWNQDTLESKINEYKMVDMITNNNNNHYVKVHKKNLMIEVPSNTLVLDADPDFLRPELAQGIFVNFKSYQNYFQGEDAGFKSFGIAQIGKSYRKEISPQPFIRMREFTQAEIEYFVDPINKSHFDYDKYKDVIVPLLTDEMQEKGIDIAININIKSAISQNLISHKLMAYFLAKIYLFANEIGLKTDKIRFRQHQKNEMAHYASQCWDLECLVSGSWLECVGCADRGCYDLTAHGELSAKRKFIEPKKIKKIIIKPNVSQIKNSYSNSNEIKTYFRDLDQNSAIIFTDLMKNCELNFTWTINNTDYVFTKLMFDIEEKNVMLTHESFIPHIIEPSFGIDRLLYAVLEQNIWQREINERRYVLSLPKCLSVYNVAVFPLHKKEEMSEIADEIRAKMVQHGYKCYIDDSGVAIGKRYVRCDEIGVEYVITIDPGSIKTGMVTIRYRDSMEQIMVHTSEIVNWFIKLMQKN